MSACQKLSVLSFKSYISISLSTSRRSWNSRAPCLSDIQLRPLKNLPLQASLMMCQCPDPSIGYQRIHLLYLDAPQIRYPRDCRHINYFPFHQSEGIYYFCPLLSAFKGYYQVCKLFASTSSFLHQLK